MIQGGSDPAAACPTPGKVRYATLGSAKDSAQFRTGVSGTSLYPYLCVCSWWHMSRRETSGFNPEDLEPGDADQQLLADATQEVFADVVARDIRTTVSLEEALSLRHPANLARWSSELKQLNIRTQGQLARRAGDRSPDAVNWRQKITAFEQGIHQRRAECRRRYSQVRQAQVAKRAAARPARDESRHAATMRLIEAHREEWLKYWREELTSRGYAMEAEGLN